MSIKLDIYLANILKDTLSLEPDDFGEVSYKIDTTPYSPELMPYSLLFTDTDTNEFIRKELYIVTPVIYQAMEELRFFTDRINNRIRMDDLKFDDTDYLKCLKAARDTYNASWFDTDITMMGATGVIYGFWIAYAKMAVLNLRYLDEGLTSFDYQGSAIQLTVDVTEYLERQAESISQWIESENIQRHKDEMRKVGGGTGDGGSSSVTGNTSGSQGKSRVHGATGATLNSLTGNRNRFRRGLQSNF